MNAPFRLTPVMASRKLAALAFIRRHFEERGASPSYAEIGAALGVGRSHAKRVVKQLERDGAIRRAGGAQRGIVLPDRVEAALKELAAAGVALVAGELIAPDAFESEGGTNPSLPRAP